MLLPSAAAISMLTAAFVSQAGVRASYNCRDDPDLLTLAVMQRHFIIRSAKPVPKNAADAGSGTAAVLMTPLPDTIYPSLVRLAIPEAEPVALANSPVPGKGQHLHLGTCGEPYHMLVAEQCLAIRKHEGN